MANRFYFDAQTAAPISPSFDASWEQNGQAVRLYSPRKGLTTRVSALTNSTSVTVPITTTQQILIAQFITDPIPYPTRIGGRFNIVMRGLENATTNNAYLAYILRLLNNDGSIVRGTLATQMSTTGATEWVGTAATRIFANVALTNITAEAGDRLCLEVGAHAQAPTAAGSALVRMGYVDAADFALTSALTTDLNPWWELDQDVFPQLPNNQQIFRGADGSSVTESWR